MNIEVKELDRGYEQCASLNELASGSGSNLINSLESNIASLKTNWIANDATEHINNLINVHDALVSLITAAKAVSASAGNSMIAIQKVRNSNGGQGQIGDELSAAAPSSITIAKCTPTEEYNVNPSAANDLATLVEICSNYATFSQNYEDITSSLLANWTDGANHGEAVASFNRFKENSSVYSKYLNDAKENLTIAVDNIKQL